MANPSVGAVTMAFLRGQVPALGTGMREITREGRNGHAYKQIGTRAPVGELTTITDCASAAGAATHRTNCAALKGTVVTVTYDDGQTATNVAILDVVPVRCKRVATAVGGLASGEWLQTMRFVVQQKA